MAPGTPLPVVVAMTGYEQGRSIAAALTGDLVPVRAVELALPDTGVCGGAGPFDQDFSSAGCCGVPAGPQELTLTGLSR